MLSVVAITGSIYFLILFNLHHQSHAILEANLVSRPHLSSVSIAHAAEDFVKRSNLLPAQRIFKRNEKICRYADAHCSVRRVIKPNPSELYIA